MKQKVTRAISHFFLAFFIYLPFSLVWYGIEYFLEVVYPGNKDIFTLFSLATLGLGVGALREFASDVPFRNKLLPKLITGLKASSLFVLFGLIVLLFGEFGKRTVLRIWFLNIYPNIIVAFLLTIILNVVTKLRGKEKFGWDDFWGAVFGGAFLGWFATYAHREVLSTTGPLSLSWFGVLFVPITFGMSFAFEQLGMGQEQRSELDLITAGFKYTKLVKKELLRAHIILVNLGYSSPKIVKWTEGFNEREKMYLWMLDTGMTLPDERVFEIDRWTIGLASDENGKNYFSIPLHPEVRGETTQEGVIRVISKMFEIKQIDATKELMKGPK